MIKARSQVIVAVRCTIGDSLKNESLEALKDNAFRVKTKLQLDGDLTIGESYTRNKALPWKDIALCALGALGDKKAASILRAIASSKAARMPEELVKNTFPIDTIEIAGSAKFDGILEEIK